MFVYTLFRTDNLIIGVRWVTNQEFITAGKREVLKRLQGRDCKTCYVMRYVFS